MENLKNIIKELKKLREEENLNFSDGELIDNSVRIFNTQFIQENKSQKTPYKPQYPIKDQNTNELATEAQISYLKKNKINFNKDTTKKQAFLLIKKDKEDKELI